MSQQDTRGPSNQSQAVVPLDMAAPATPAPGVRKTPRVWPAIVLIVAFWIFRLIVTHVELATVQRFMGTMFMLMLTTLLFLCWWLISRRTSWVERVVALVGCIILNVIGAKVADPSLRGPFWLVLVPPFMLTVWAGWWLLARRADPMVRTGGLLVVLALTCGAFASLRIDGLNGDTGASYSFRWRPTSEQVYLASMKGKGAAATSVAAIATPIVANPDDWPGFRGPQRDGVARGVKIGTDWSAHPPKLAWRQPVGPGWSSPVVVGGRVFTQEQLAENELVTCRAVDSGSLIWSHSDAARFEESMGGPGPRATPLFVDGRLYTLGATGIFNCLDAASGKLIWSRNLATDTGVAPPMWGFSSSPLVMQGIVIVYVGGAKGLLGYHADTGEPAWSLNNGVQSYISAQPAVLDGREQVLFMSDMALVSADPATGKLLWSHDVPAPQMWRAIQPHVISPTQVVVSSESDVGTALVEIKHDGDAWLAQRKWASRALKPSFNDFVVQDGYAYGFDGEIFCCTNLQTGKRAWREGNYGHGQAVLLADQKLLLIISEQGELVLLKATPEHHEEVSHAPAISGKTWNHPAIAGGKLVVRNGQEMACFELPKMP